jgi:hypothetical protein
VDLLLGSDIQIFLYTYLKMTISIFVLICEHNILKLNVFQKRIRKLVLNIYISIHAIEQWLRDLNQDHVELVSSPIGDTFDTGIV